LVFGIVLLLVELHHLAFFALFVAVGAFVATLVALVAPDAYLAQGAAAVSVSIIGVVAIRPYAERAYRSHRRSGHVAHGVHGGLIGAEAVTLDPVGDAHDVGHVRLAGERWLAVSGGGADRIPSGTRVVVTAVHGTTLTVWPSGTITAPPHELGRDGSST
jgi:membrane protein implicated in regulation of membrane protease activity